MTPLCTATAREYLMRRGWGYSEDHIKLAARLEECCGEFVEELEEAGNPIEQAERLIEDR